MRLVFANQTEEDILLRPELDAFAQVAPSPLYNHQTLHTPQKS